MTKPYHQAPWSGMFSQTRFESIRPGPMSGSAGNRQYGSPSTTRTKEWGRAREHVVITNSVRGIAEPQVLEQLRQALTRFEQS